MIGEAIGTSSFLFFAFAGTEVAVYGKTSGEDAAFDPASVLYISIAFGISLMVNVFIFFRISGGLFNPAVTFAMCLTKSIAPMRCFLLFVSQMLACMFSTYIVSVIIPQPLGVVTSLTNGATIAQGVCLEMILTAYLILTIFMLAGEKHKGTFMAPVGIGMALFSAHLVAVQWTGCGINPARAFGPAVISGTWTDHWIYWIGPLAGSILASGLYKFFKHMRYEEANPGQDADEIRRKSMSVARNNFT
ncbi:aquaporin-like protein [Saccharata proteae CBS 121410]|uniref:Aquaporin-like protein n=1 Tax=Saccharata proteae CBS 121410 TaxID=1314787 RepID=A0A9P4I503_9PEZI|nr:aquaporin-like protein [Saccharata proteae CBS 121410]